MVNCPRCSFIPLIHPEHGSWYTAFCHFCMDSYCAMCGDFPDHFPAWCSDRIAWKDDTIHRTNEYYEVANIVRGLNDERAAMYLYRDQIGHVVFDHHPHISYAAEEMQKILRILAWTRVIAFIHPNMPLLHAGEFRNLEHNFAVLRNQFNFDVHQLQLGFDVNNDGLFNLAGERWNACNSVVQLLGRLQRRHDGDFDHAVHIPPLPQWELNFSQSMSRSEREWNLSALRPPPLPPPPPPPHI